MTNGLPTTIHSKKGILNIDEWVANNDSFKKIMEDGIVTDEEVKAQSDKVVSMLKEIEAKYAEAQLAEIKNLLAETSVLYAVYQLNALQTINK